MSKACTQKIYHLYYSDREISRISQPLASLYLGKTDCRDNRMKFISLPSTVGGQES